MAGYSATTLVKKLGLAPRHTLHVVDAPEGYRLGLVDVKVCAVDDVWSGLKLVVRKELR